MGFLELIGSVLTGGATGLIGSILSKGIGLFEAYQERKNMQLEFEHELALLDRQAKLKAQETENALAIANAETAASLREASYRHDTRTGRPHNWVIDTLRLIRPVLTILLIGLTWFIYSTIADATVQMEITASILYMTASAVTWWFGDRSLNRKK